MRAREGPRTREAGILRVALGMGQRGTTAWAPGLVGAGGLRSTGRHWGTGWCARRSRWRPMHGDGPVGCLLQPVLTRPFFPVEERGQLDLGTNAFKEVTWKNDVPTPAPA